jgi:hypothetical protein
MAAGSAAAVDIIHSTVVVSRVECGKFHCASQSEAQAGVGQIRF